MNTLFTAPFALIWLAYQFYIHTMSTYVGISSNGQVKAHVEYF